MALTTERRKQLDDIVSKLYQQQAPREDVQLIVDDFKRKYDSATAPQRTPQLGERLGNAAVGAVGDTARFVIDLFTGTVKGGLSTASATGGILAKAAGALPGGPTKQEQQQVAGASERALVPHGTVQNIAFAGEQIGEFFVPGTAPAKVQKLIVGGTKAGAVVKTLLGLTGKVGTESAMSSIQRYLQTGDVQQAALAGLGAGALSAGGSALKPVAQFFGSILKNTAGAISGKGVTVIETVMQRPQAAGEALRQPVQAMGQIAQQTTKAVSKMRREVSNVYGEGVDQLPLLTTYHTQRGGMATVMVDGKPVVLTSLGVKQKLTSKLREFDVMVDPKARTFDFLESPLKGSEETQLKEVFQIVNDWQDISPAGINRLATKISNYRGPDTSRTFNAIIDSVSSTARDYVGDRVPAVAKLNEEFAKRTKFLDAIDDILRTGQGTDPSAQLKTAQAIGTLFNTNKELAREFVQQLEREAGIDILGTEAGRQLASGITRTGTVFSDAIRTLVNTLITPKAVGQMAISAQRLKDKIPQPVRAVGERIFGL